jgi:hypothetical protein
MSETLNGACLCGRVEYEVQDPEGLGYCHCTRCQRWTGSSLAGVVVAKENFKFTKGEDLVTRYESEFAPRNFCSNCGSSLYDDLGEKYFVAAGLMRDLELDPSFHLQVAYKASWHEIGGDVRSSPRIPRPDTRGFCSHRRGPPPERGFLVIGETGFEPATARPPAGCATRLRHSP